MALPIVFFVAGLVDATGFFEFAVLDDAAADAGGESEIDCKALEVVGFSEAAEVGIVFHENWDIE